MNKIDRYNVYDFEVEKVEIKSYNTNNDWGFGGGRGLIYTFSDNLYCKIGFASTRHRGEFPYITIYKNEKRIFDEEPTKGMKEKAKELIKKLLS